MAIRDHSSELLIGRSLTIISVLCIWGPVCLCLLVASQCVWPSQSTLEKLLLLLHHLPAAQQIVSLLRKASSDPHRTQHKVVFSLSMRPAAEELARASPIRSIHGPIH